MIDIAGNSGGGQFIKAQIVPMEGKNSRSPIECMFNPREYAISRSVNWKTESNDNNDNGNKVYLGGSPAKLTLELFFDTYARRQSAGVVEDVRKYTAPLWALSEMETGDGAKGQGSSIKKGKPTSVLFQWGQTWHFQAVITDIEQQFTLFMPDGTPVRSVMKTTFEQADTATSFEGKGGLKSYHVSQGIRDAAGKRGFVGDLRRTPFGKGQT
ncbi:MULTISPECIES: hypothetical protein [Deinococcus]|uniref:Uncharacterized protein n=2 Tax=Deinococcus soli (ex Cha et al. 2016) TaxID=1309411 RepID=A0ACC6KF05_9DEIO|nr:MULTISPECIES: hypothetical protein [Deinococcus]MDK2012099.1 hypothetical protein [Deinococcus sp. 43]MDR6217963.1 hypothetical protein [Deinococcus soli (ex Cha et al. 2016)]MDR6328213.1 hypothetical protein [Deinococcus soli (ex Cha et al. 2016)]MDR6751065.1 hypothetical protein [Deinococcus soli (ex Cha et al. 2016)]